MGLVVSFNRPGGNVTGMTFMSSELVAKRLGLKGGVPAAPLAMLVDPNDPQLRIRREMRAAAAALGGKSNVRTPAAIGRSSGFRGPGAKARRRAIRRRRCVLHKSTRSNRHAGGASRGSRRSITDREFVEAGGLMSYGNRLRTRSPGGIYVGRILKGEKPGDLPVMRSTKFEFLINLQDGQGARPRGAAGAARHRRRGDRMREGASKAGAIRRCKSGPGKA